MKRTALIAVVGALTALAMLAAYAHATGAGPFRRVRAAACQPTCDPATAACEKAQTCHDGADCVCDATDCPSFQDKDADGKCDVADDCGRHDQSDCHNGASRCGGRTLRGYGGGHGACHSSTKQPETSK